jgi:hypothetical protein
MASVRLDCPKCEREIWTQSEHGNKYKTFYPSTMPKEVVKELSGQSVDCNHCGVSFRLVKKVTYSLLMAEDK